ncbi:STAS domain-containing protein [Actinokineospora enzanensis]|uniref:STAS domain-containing protein n=1 Tax=Actinokineospora enzanensis TaxID=155975 RepID=UPI0003812AD0|nr:STAS domain-containing protein [Actinokineospora enzanensis]
MTELTHTVGTEAERIVVAIKGELDTHTAVEFKRALLGLIQEGGEVVVDLGGLTFIDSSGLSVFIAAHKRALSLGAKVALDFVPAFLVRILAITGLDEVIPILR